MDVKLTPTVLFRAISAVAACIGPNCEGAMMRAATAASDVTSILPPADVELRDYFAGQALAGMLADLPKTMYGLDWQRNVAEGAYSLADAMLAERAK